MGRKQCKGICPGASWEWSTVFGRLQSLPPQDASLLRPTGVTLVGLTGLTGAANPAMSPSTNYVHTIMKGQVKK